MGSCFQAFSTRNSAGEATNLEMARNGVKQPLQTENRAKRRLGRPIYSMERTKAGI
jgi:hypothetical protein